MKKSTIIGIRQFAICLVVALVCVLVVASSASAASGCFAIPSACGFPDSTNTGVPPGTILRPSGSLTLATNGEVLEGVDLVGTVTVTADDVTIRDSRLTTTGTGETAVINLAQGAEDFTLEDSEVGGNGSSANAPESNVWNHYNNPGARVIDSHLHGTPDNWEGGLALAEDSFFEVDASSPGSHDENIFVWCTAVNIQHSTLFNYHEQTATIFGETNGCNGNDFTVEDSLLAGGGFVLYPQSGNPHPIPEAQTTIVGNRFARCLGAPVYNAQSGGTACKGGPDSNGIFPQGGYFGLRAAINGPTAWEENVWDDEAARPTGSTSLLDSPPAGGQAEYLTSSSVRKAGSPLDRSAVGNRVTARWRPLAGVRVGKMVVLDGTPSSGPRPLHCVWTIANRTGSVVYGRMTRCRALHRFRWPGVRYVKLEVRAGNGSSDSLRRRVLITPPAG